MHAALAFWLSALAQQSGAAVENPRVTNDRWPSNYDAKSWAADVFRIEGARSDEEKTLALYKWVRLLQHWGLQCGDGTRGKAVIECDAVKKINVYPFGECSDFGVTSAALGHAGGLKAMEAHVPGHTQLEVAYRDADGVERSHRLDPFWGIVVYDRTGTHIATWEEIKADPTVATKPSRTVLPWGDKTGDRERFADKGSCKPGLRVRAPQYTMDKPLLPGETYVLRWEREAGVPFHNSHPDPGYRKEQEWGGFQRFQYAGGKVENLAHGHELLRPHVEVGKYGVQVSIGHGRLKLAPVLGPGFEAGCHEPPVNVAADGKGLRPAKAGAPATLVYAVRSPYVLVSSEFAGSFRAGKGDSVRVSIAHAEWRERGFTLDQALPAKPEWTPVWESRGEGAQEMRLADLPLRGEYQYLVRLEMTGDPKSAGVDTLAFNHVFQQNMLALPRLLPGKNAITVNAAALRPGWKLRVTYAWDDAKGQGRRDVRLVERVPFTYEIAAAGEKPADVRTRWLALEAIR